MPFLLVIKAITTLILIDDPAGSHGGFWVLWRAAGMSIPPACSHPTRGRLFGPFGHPTGAASGLSFSVQLNDKEGCEWDVKLSTPSKQVWCDTVSEPYEAPLFPLLSEPKGKEKALLQDGVRTGALFDDCRRTKDNTCVTRLILSPEPRRSLITPPNYSLSLHFSLSWFVASQPFAHEEKERR